MMLRWEEFHALNASHVIHLGKCYAPTEVEQVAIRVSRSLGLLPISFDADRRTILFHDERSEGIETTPLFTHFSFVGPVRPAMEAVLNDQLNREFGTVPHWPIRFALIDTPGEGQFLVLTYHHVLSDSRGISLLAREVVRALDGRPARITRLDFQPPSLKRIFPVDLGWRGLLRRGRSTISELLTSQSCCALPRHRQPRTELAIECGVRSLEFSTSLLKETAHRLGVTVQAVVAAAFLEALHLNFADLIHSSLRKSLAVYSPADLRRESNVDVDRAVSQILGCLTSRVEIPPGTSFQTIVNAVAQQAKRDRSSGHHREHSAHMDFMSRIWDMLPRGLNRVAGPSLIPLAGFISNVNLTEFLSEELRDGLIQDYLRFSGTGILSPMMLGITTVGGQVNLTTTHHGDVFSEEEVRRIVSHVAWRLSGEVDLIASQAEFLSRPFNQPEFACLTSTESTQYWRNRLSDLELVSTSRGPRNERRYEPASTHETSPC